MSPVFQSGSGYQLQFNWGFMQLTWSFSVCANIEIVVETRFSLGSSETYLTDYVRLTFVLYEVQIRDYFFILINHVECI